MNEMITFLLSIFEWTSLLIFPFVILGYSLRNFIKPIGIIALFMSLFSILIRLTSIHVLVIIGVQMVLLYLLVKWLCNTKKLEAIVLTGMGYGFYILTQMIVVEFLVSALQSTHIQFLVNFSGTITIQMINFIILFLFSLTVYYSKFQLHELRQYIRSPYKDRYHPINRIIMLISLLTLTCTWLIVYAMLTVNTSYKQVTIILIMLTSFFILSCYFILHMKFQEKRLIEANKFFLDQEQQVSLLVEKIKIDDQNHYKAIMKLLDKGNPQLIKDYIRLNQLEQDPLAVNLYTDLSQEMVKLLYAFLINKRKLASLFGVTIQVSEKMEYDYPITLQQLRCLSAIIDDLIYMIYAAALEDKTIYFSIEATDQKSFSFQISSSLTLEENSYVGSKLFDALLKLKNLGAIIQSDFQPLTLNVRNPLK